MMGGIKLCSISFMCRSLLMMCMYVCPVIGESYATAACTTGTYGMTPKSSEKGDTLTVMSVLYKIIEFLSTTGESVCGSVSVLVCEDDDDDDDDDIRRKLLICSSIDGEMFLLSPLS